MKPVSILWRRLDTAGHDACSLRESGVGWQLGGSAVFVHEGLQRYERRSEFTYWYSAPRFDYAALLEVDALDFVRRYPGLWEVEAASAPNP